MGFIQFHVDRQSLQDLVLDEAGKAVAQTALDIRDELIAVHTKFGGSLLIVPGSTNTRRQPPSVPYEPPHVQTGKLLESIKVEPAAKYTRFILATDYADPLDLGHDNVLPRPFIDRSINAVVADEVKNSFFSF